VVKRVGVEHARAGTGSEDVAHHVAPFAPAAGAPPAALFCIFDGHHGASAAQRAAELLPRELATRWRAAGGGGASPPPSPPPALLRSWGSEDDAAGAVASAASGGDAAPSAPASPGTPGAQPASGPAEPAAPGPLRQAFEAAFLAADAGLDTDDGCTATAVAVEFLGASPSLPASSSSSAPGGGGLRVQAANVGDSHAMLFVRPPGGGGDASPSGAAASAASAAAPFWWALLTEDHRIAHSAAEQARIKAVSGHEVRSRLYGLNIARMLGDRVLKNEALGFTAAPAVCAPLDVPPGAAALLVLASDGLWDAVEPGAVAAHLAKRWAGGPGGAPAAPGGAAAAEAAALADGLLTKAVRNRSRDDITVVVVRLQ